MASSRTFDLPSHPPVSTGSAVQSGPAARAATVAALVALTLALLAGAYALFGGGTSDGFPDSTQQWTD